MKTTATTTACMALIGLVGMVGLTGCSERLENGGQPQNLEAITLKAGGMEIRAEAALTAEQRQIGLMYRHALRANGGMIFVFDEPARQCFWMKNTKIPLDAAFLADDGAVVNVEGMKAMTLDEHCSAWPVRYVLEMNKGWFAANGIKPGDKIMGLPTSTKLSPAAHASPAGAASTPLSPTRP